MAQTFDTAKFLNTEYSDSFATERPLIPEGEWRAMIKNIDVAAGNRKETVMMRVHLIFEDEDLAAHPDLAGREQIVTTTTIFCDIDPETQILKWSGGQNWQLGQIRAALGQNNPGKPWWPSQMEGKGPVLVKVEHRKSGGKDGKDERINDNIVRWAAA